VLGPNPFLFLVLSYAFSAPLLMVDPPLAYVGLGPGQELIPYFLALLGVVGTALLAVLQWPITAFFRYFSKARGAQKELTKDQPTTAAVPENPGEATPDKP
jgi:hypothetical protein